MSLYRSIDIAQQGMRAQRIRLQAVSSNIANVSTTETPEGGPYRRRKVLLEAVEGSNFSDFLNEERLEGVQAGVAGVRASQITFDPSPFISKFEPDHPQANAQGYVDYPNVNPAVEMVDLVSITRSYEANLSVVRSAKEMIGQTMDLLRV